MKYLIERSLYYYFLMREVTDADVCSWGFIAKNFGLKPEDIKAYESVLSSSTLDELATSDDIEMYRNYLNGYFCNAAEFGKAKRELEAIDAKALALYKLKDLFGNAPIKNNRLRSLSHNYGRDHVASVLYALQIMYINGSGGCGDLAESILTAELKEGKNSDAGLILLNLNCGKASETAAYLKGLPDMLLRPDMLKYFSERYGCAGENIVISDVRTIGFGGGK